MRATWQPFGRHMRVYSGRARRLALHCSCLVAGGRGGGCETGTERATSGELAGNRARSSPQVAPVRLQTSLAGNRFKPFRRVLGPFQAHAGNRKALFRSPVGPQVGGPNRPSWPREWRFSAQAGLARAKTSESGHQRGTGGDR
jgi:hypothetical protein